MANRARGETELQASGKTYRLRLTLGALAEIEDGLALGDLSEIETRLKNLRAADLAIVLAALLRGGGHDLSPVEALRLPADLSAIVNAITEAFSFGGLPAEAAEAAKAGAPTEAAEAAKVGPFRGTASSKPESA